MIWLKTPLDILAICAQLTGAILWPILQWTDTSKAKDEMEFAWSLPIGLILASFGWWETFTTNEESAIPFMRFMSRVRTNMISQKNGDKYLENTRYFTYLWISVWKSIVFCGGAWLIVSLNGLLQDPLNMFTKFLDSFDSHSFNVTENMDVVVEGNQDFFNADGYESRYR